MQLSFSTTLALLAAAQITAAWTLLIFENTKSCRPDKPNRALLGGKDKNDGICYTLGRDLPGVDCNHWEPGWSGKLPCKGYMVANSASVSPDTACWLWTTDDCKGEVSATVNDGATCKQPGELMWAYKSFKCVTTKS